MAFVANKGVVKLCLRRAGRFFLKIYGEPLLFPNLYLLYIERLVVRFLHMKHGSRGNYRVLYRDLEPEVLHNHFSIVETQQALLGREGLEEKKALKAVREMARVHFSDLEPDGYIGNKKAWYGHRWTSLYSRWGDYLSERAYTPVSVEAPPSKKSAKDQSSYLMDGIRGRLGLLRNAAALVLIFMAGYYLSLSVRNEPAAPAATDHSVQGMLVGEDFNILLERFLSDEATQILYFPNLNETLAVFALEDQPFAVIGDRWVKVGDHIVLDDTRGYITEINPNWLVLKTEAGSWQVDFPRHVMMMQPTFDKGDIIVYPEKGNLVTILQVLARVKNWKMTGTPVNQNISGRFTTLDSFMEGCRYLGVEFHDELVDLSGAYEPGSFISFDGLWYQPYGSLNKLIEIYEEHLPYDVEIVGHFPHERWVINYGLQFKEFCEFFNLKTEIRGDLLIVKGGNDENG